MGALCAVGGNNTGQLRGSGVVRGADRAPDGMALAARQRGQHVSTDYDHTVCRFQKEALSSLAGQIERDRPHRFAVRADLDAIPMMDGAYL